jgi:N-methylhydantoinase B
MRVASGGGYGDPLMRDLQLVQEDINNGLVSIEAARKIYGVVFDQANGLNVEATQELRKKLRQNELKGLE